MSRQWARSGTAQSDNRSHRLKGSPTRSYLHRLTPNDNGATGAQTLPAQQEPREVPPEKHTAPEPRQGGGQFVPVADRDKAAPPAGHPLVTDRVWVNAPHCVLVAGVHPENVGPFVPVAGRLVDVQHPLRFARFCVNETPRHRLLVGGDQVLPQEGALLPVAGRVSVRDPQFG